MNLEDALEMLKRQCTCNQNGQCTACINHHDLVANEVPTLPKTLLELVLKDGQND